MGEGPREIDAERVDGAWALHRAVRGTGWSVTWVTSGHAIGATYPMDRDVAERVFEMVTTKWAHWPRRREGQRLTAEIKRRTTAALRSDIAAITGDFIVGEP